MNSNTTYDQLRDRGDGISRDAGEMKSLIPIHQQGTGELNSDKVDLPSMTEAISESTLVEDMCDFLVKSYALQVEQNIAKKGVVDDWMWAKRLPFITPEGRQNSRHRKLGDTTRTVRNYFDRILRWDDEKEGVNPDFKMLLSGGWDLMISPSVPRPGTSSSKEVRKQQQLLLQKSLVYTGLPILRSSLSEIPYLVKTIVNHHTPDGKVSGPIRP